MDEPTKKELLYKLLYQIMIEIREEAYLKENKKIHCLSDLVHNIPLILLKTENENDYDTILKKINDKAESLGIQNWLKNALNQL
jgi:hypothetical protein